MKKIYLVIALLQVFFIVSSSYTALASIGLTSGDNGNDQLTDSNGGESDGDTGEPEEDNDEPEEDNDEPEPSNDNFKKTHDSPDTNPDANEEDQDEEYLNGSSKVTIISIDPNPAEKNEIITFIGSVENSSEYPYVLTWDFGDFSEAQGTTVIHSYSEEVVIEKPPSLVDAGGPYSGKVL